MSCFGADITQILTAFNKCWCASYLQIVNVNIHLS